MPSLLLLILPYVNFPFLQQKQFLKPQNLSCTLIHNKWRLGGGPPCPISMCKTDVNWPNGNWSTKPSISAGEPNKLWQKEHSEKSTVPQKKHYSSSPKLPFSHSTVFMFTPEFCICDLVFFFLKESPKPYTFQTPHTSWLWLSISDVL